MQVTSHDDDDFDALLKQGDGKVSVGELVDSWIRANLNRLVQIGFRMMLDAPNLEYECPPLVIRGFPSEADRAAYHNHLVGRLLDSREPMNEKSLAVLHGQEVLQLARSRIEEHLSRRVLAASYGSKEEGHA